MDQDTYLIYLVDIKNRLFYEYKVLNQFNLDITNEIYIYEHILLLALSSDFTTMEFTDKESLQEYVKVNILNEYTEEDFCLKPKHLKYYKTYNAVANFFKEQLYDLTKLVFVLTIVSLLTYFINHKAIFMLNSIYGESMKPTLHTYSAGVVVYPYNIQYGDLIACRKEINGSDVNVLKRVIALPGDHVEIINDYVYVNGKKIKEPYIKDGYRTESNETITWETIWKKTAKREYFIFDSENIPTTIPANYYFVLGDNRKDSYDSRNFGLVYYNDIVGKYVFTLLTI